MQHASSVNKTLPELRAGFSVLWGTQQRKIGLGAGNLWGLQPASSADETVTAAARYNVIIVIFGLNISLSVKTIHLIDGTDFFKICNLVVGGKAVVTCLYSSLERQRERERERESGTRAGVYTC